MSNLKKHRVETGDAPGAIGPYSQGIRSRAPAYLFISGQIGIDPGSGEFSASTAAGQAEQCLKNLLAILAAAGGSAASVVKTTIYLASIEDFSAVNEIYARFFSEPYPARATFGGCELPKGALVEIEAVAQLEG